VIAIGVVVGEDARPGHSLHLPLRHLPVQGVGDDDVNVVDAVAGEHVANNLENWLANVGSRHRWQGKTDVVDSDRDTHAGFELRKQRVAAVRVIERVTNRGLAVRQSLDRWIRIKNTCADRQVFKDEVFAGGNDARRAVAVDVDDRFVRFSSKLKRHYFKFSIGQSWCRAVCRNRMSGLITAGWPTIDSIGRSLMLSV